MALGPIVNGRLPNSLAASRALANLETNTRNYYQLQDQISTGQRFQTIGEDPSAALNTFILQQSLERKSQISDNLEVNRSLLSASDDNLSRIGNIFSQLKSHILSGLGDSSSTTEKQQLATEVGTLIQELVSVGNTKFRDRYLFGGSQIEQPPFSVANGNDAILFTGNLQEIESFVTLDSLLANNIDTGTSLKPFANINGSDLNPALTASTRISDLYSGTGTGLGTIEVTVDTGGGPQTEQIDLTNANSIQDLVTRIQDPFTGDLTVSVTTNGLTLTPSAGTVQVNDLPNSRVAADLGIDSAAAAIITSNDLDPQLSRFTTISSLNGGTGIGATLGTGLTVTNGIRTETIDLDGLTTLEQLFNEFKKANIDVDAGIADDGKGVLISSRLSGVGLSIGENGGDNAAQLGILTFSGSTSLAELNLGKGVPVDGSAEMEIIRRDGSQEIISLGGSETVQDVLDVINAVDPGVLVASLNTIGNGIVLSDSSGTGTLRVVENDITTALSIDGSEDGNADLVGVDVDATATTDLLTSLNAGAGVPVGVGTLDITRRDGSVVNIDLSTAVTVQDVLDLVNAVDPGILVMSHDANSENFILNDSSGTGSLTVADNGISTGLGINGSEDGVVDLVGGDPNPHRSNGLIDIMFRLRDALQKGDNQELEIVNGLLDNELQEFNFVRGDLGGRLKTIDNHTNRLVDEDIQIQESLSEVFDTDLTEAITAFASLQVNLQAAQQITAQSLQLSLFSYL